MRGFPRRRFVRVPVRIPAVLDHRIAAVVRSLSLGGCLLEMSEAVTLAQEIPVAFSVGQETFELTAAPLGLLSESQLRLRFKFPSPREFRRLARAIERLIGAPLRDRPAEIVVTLLATVDRAPATLTHLSPTGCRLKPSTRHEACEIIEVEATLDRHTIHLAAEVRECDPDGIGVEFLLPDPDQLQIIAEFIAHRTHTYVSLQNEH